MVEPFDIPLWYYQSDLSDNRYNKMRNIKIFNTRKETERVNKHMYNWQLCKLSKLIVLGKFRCDSTKDYKHRLI